MKSVTPLNILLLVLMAASHQEPDTIDSPWDRIPTVISESQFLRASKRLHLTNEQELIARLLYDTYVKERRERFQNEIREFHREEADAIRRTNLPGVPVSRIREDFQQLRDRMGEIRRRVLIHEQEFLSHFQAVLHEDQHARWPLVVRGLARARLTAFMSQFPEGRIDLVALGEGFAIEDVPWIDFVNEYEPLYLSALRKATNAAHEFEWNLLEIREIQQRLQQEEPDSFRAHQFRERIRALQERFGRARVTASEQLAEVNREWIERLIARVDDPLKPVIRERYLEAAYPEVYPDPTAATRLFDVIEAMDDLSDGQREVMSMLRQNWSNHHAVLCERMVETIHFRYWSMYAGKPSPIGNDQELWEALKSIGYEREALNQAQIGQVRPHLTGDQIARLPQWDFVKNPPPRPWDRDYDRLWRQRTERRDQ
ncbi:MAG: hypothetical protein HRU76_06365 [Phycisphaeraceae bacterium]|nr:hypothetical protein [Phycisphaerales bacterium]QOJ17218.1 MAG: hypothetical protein HRU76_06365 [Phycisphaeraceae bacterium]